MKLYRISQNVNNGYDTYDSAVVAAETEEEAKMIHPSGNEWDGKELGYDSWCSAEKVKVEYIGEAKEGTLKGIIVSSFNAG
jgi:hypothetical protein